MVIIDKFCSVVGQMGYRAQASLGDILVPDAITSSNGEYEEQLKLAKLMSDQYNAYKRNYSGNLKFDIEYGGKNLKRKKNYIVFLPAVTIENAPLQVVFIFFDTATYDEIERDVKVTYYFLNQKKSTKDKYSTETQR